MLANAVQLNVDTKQLWNSLTLLVIEVGESNNVHIYFVRTFAWKVYLSSCHLIVFTLHIPTLSLFNWISEYFARLHLCESEIYVFCPFSPPVLNVERIITVISMNYYCQHSQFHINSLSLCHAWFIYVWAKKKCALSNRSQLKRSSQKV